MPLDTGLLIGSSIANALHGGLDEYKENKRYQDSLAMQKKMFQAGLLEKGFEQNSNTGELEQSPYAKAALARTQTQQDLENKSKALGLIPEDQRLNSPAGRAALLDVLKSSKVNTGLLPSAPSQPRATQSTPDSQGVNAALNNIPQGQPTASAIPIQPGGLVSPLAAGQPQSQPQQSQQNSSNPFQMDSNFVPKSIRGKPTPAQESADKAYGKEYEDYVAGGGYVAAKNGLQKLQAIRDQLSHQPDLTGGISNALPDTAKAYVNPNGLALEQGVQKVILKDLKHIFPGKVTEGQMSVFLKKSFDPRLPGAANVQKLDDTIADLSQQAEAKQKAADYYENAGTLKGFKGGMQVVPPSNQPQTNQAQSSANSASKLNGAHPQDSQAIEWAKANPNNPLAATIIQLNGGVK